MKIILLSMFLMFFVSGCQTMLGDPADGDTKPWTQPESWESQPNIGVPM